MSAIWPFSISVLASVSGISKTFGSVPPASCGGERRREPVVLLASRSLMSGYFGLELRRRARSARRRRLLGAGLEPGDRDGDLVVCRRLGRRRWSRRRSCTRPAGRATAHRPGRARWCVRTSSSLLREVSPCPDGVPVSGSVRVAWFGCGGVLVRVERCATTRRCRVGAALPRAARS